MVQFNKDTSPRNDFTSIRRAITRLRNMIADLDARVETWTGIKTGELETTGNGSVGGTMDITGACTLSDILTNTNKILTDSDGNITQPNQPNFLVKMDGSQELVVPADGDDIETVEFDSEVFDLSGDFNTGNYEFTAPKDGKYYFSVNTTFNNDNSSGIHDIGIQMVTSNRTYHFTMSDADTKMSLDGFSMTMSMTADMDANDTCKIRVIYTGDENDTGDIADIRIDLGSGGGLSTQVLDTEPVNFFAGSLIN